MSSAILYLAIVAIWAVVLVPRWLRHPHAEPQHAQMQWTEMHEEEAEPASGDAPEAPAAGHRGPVRADHSAAAGQPAAAGFSGAAGPSAAAEPPPAPAPAPAPRSRRLDRQAGPAAAPLPAPASAFATGRRARVLRARRRTLFTLILLTAGAVMLAIARLAAWWVAVPPTVMLAGFLMLLREAARIDAERAAAARAGAAAQAERARPREHRGDTAARRPAEPAAAGTAAAARTPAGTAAGTPGEAPSPAVPGRLAAPAGPDAEIIDISARIGDQLYDQYSDAEARAIGD